MTCQEATASFLLIVNHADFLTIHDILQKGKLKNTEYPGLDLTLVKTDAFIISANFSHASRIFC